MILESIEHGPLIWPTIEENGVTRTKKYVELSDAEKIQADYDMKATNIILQGLPADIYSLVNYHRVAKDLWEMVQLLMQGTSLTKQERECKLYDLFDKFTHIKGETLHKYYLRFTQLINDITEDLDTYDSDCDDISNAKAVLMANISNYGSDVISEVPYSVTYLNDMENQSVHAMHDFEKTSVVDVTDNEITNDSNIIPKRFIPQQELSVEQTFWYHMSNPSTKYFDASLVKMEAPKELPKVSLVNERLKKLKFHLAKFDNVVKIRTTPDARTKGEWGTNSFDQMEAAVQQSSVDKQCLEITKKELFLENDRLLQQVMSQDVLLTVMNSMSLNGESVNMERKRNESCDKCFNLDAKLLKTQNAHNDLLKKYFKNNDLKAQLQDKDTTICKLKEIIKSMREKSKEENVNSDYCEIETKNVELENIKGKEIVDIAAQIPSANTIVPGMFKLDLTPLAPRLLQNKEAHIDYLKYTQEQVDIVWEIVEQAKAKQPLDNALDFSCKHAQRIQELLVYVRDTCPNAIKLSAKKVPVTPKNNVKKVRFAEPLTSSSNIKQNRVVEPIRDVDVKHSLLNTNSEPICATCKKSMFDGVHDMCHLDFVENVNSRAKSAKKHQKQKNWKPTGHVFTEVGLKWKPTGRTFTIVGNSCPLTRITSANVVPSKKTTSHSVETQKLELKVYSRKPKNIKNVGSSKKAKIVESKNVNHSEPNNAWGSNATDIPSSSSLVMIVRFGNDQITRIMRYGDYQLGNVTISRVYYVKGLGHNLFFVGQFCDADLEVAFRKNICFIRNLEGVDLLSGSRDINLYTISLDDMLKTSLICLLSKASKTKSWLSHRRLSHLNFACALGKSKKSSHQPKAEDTNQEKLYLLHMDLCGMMRVVSINGKRYILVIVDDYSRFTWVRFLRTKDKAPEAIIKWIKNIQIRLNATVCNVLTDNGTKFVNQTLRKFYENIASRIKHLLPALLSRTALSKGETELL
ncbi:retrovirus-related pol polyprotein from transposon TNT 1-94 [Tanacetum coccineum]